jgi:type II secretory pathway component PulF
VTTVLAVSTNETLWWITLAVGLVVAIVVWILLERLRRAVDRVDEGVGAVWTMGKRVAQNTSTTYLLQGTKARGVELLEELQQHRPPTGGSQG